MNTLNRILNTMKENNHHPGFLDWWNELHYSPIGARLESSSRCNANCIHCPREGITRPLGEMPQNIFIKCVDGLAQCPRPIHYLFLHLNGEPLLLDIDELVWRINYAKEKLPHTMITFFTNAQLLTAEISAKLICSKLDKLSFSFDGGTKEDYEAIRKGLSWEVVLENITTFCRMNKRLGSNRHIQTQSILLPQKGNLTSIDAYFARFKEIGIDDVGGSGVNNIGGLIDAASIKTDLQYNKGNPNTPCWRAFTEINVMSDGRVCACCQDVHGRVIHGDVNIDSILNIWHGESATKLREEFLMRKHPNLSPEFECCNRCDFMVSFWSPYEWWPKC